MAAGLEAVVSGAADSAVEDSEAVSPLVGSGAGCPGGLEAGSSAADSGARAGRVDVGAEEAGAEEAGDGGAAGDGASLLR